MSDSITVIEDIFQESGPDYGLSYKVSLTKNECLILIDEVQKSPDWEQEGSEFEFYKTIDGIIYNITFSSKECIITYYEDMV
ncbi:hypothetical protein [uncultured Marivirga sp.]|uniref:hypothetical protein n=1 Tax=uncultured Marivirga sp. TaxID=1123707 RepID=UPI0030EE228A